MRRVLAIACVVAGTAGILVFGSGAGGDGGDYVVRGIFDNAGFVVPGEEVRIAGARVGSVEAVDVDEIDEVADTGERRKVAKAAIVMRIDDEGFRDFREDASCLVRPQSLIGEKYVECEPTQPRAPDDEVPPELPKVPPGEPGAGQRLLPLQNNGKAVDLDLIQNIMRRPYAERFRFILNDLGAGLAGRGKDLQEVVRRANPALRELDEVLKILADENRTLADLTSNSDRILAGLARERTSVSGFIEQAGRTATATAERRADLERNFERFPAFLRELKPTMTRLRGLANQATPVVTDLRVAGDDISRATEDLGPFAKAGVPALQTLGDTSDVGVSVLPDVDPFIRNNLRPFASKARPVAQNLSSLLTSLEGKKVKGKTAPTKGTQKIMDFLFYSVSSINGFDQFGHYLRANLLLNSCIQYVTVSFPGCDVRFKSEPDTSATTSAATSSKPLLKRLRAQEQRKAERRDARDSLQPTLDGRRFRTRRDTRRSDAINRDMLEFLLGPEG